MQGTDVLTAAERPVIWCIGGSDSGGGAGIQADIQAVNQLGGHACCVITAVTAQNSCSVDAVQAVETAMLQAQFKALSQDFWPQVIKIGLLANPDQVTVVAQMLQSLQASPSAEHPTPVVVLDPVVRASCGSAMADPQTMPAALQQLFAYVDLVTPNVLEAEALTGMAIANDEDVKRASCQLIAAGCKSVLVKGGHASWTGKHCIDSWRSHNDKRLFAQPRLSNPNSHGTGCTLASAIAVLLGRGYPVEDAISIASAYLHAGLTSAEPVGKGPGPVRHAGWPSALHLYPRCGYHINELLHEHKVFSQCPDQLGLYPVVDSISWLEKLLSAGVRTLQLRIKHNNATTLSPIIKQAIALGRRYQARLFINDHWELAIEHRAYGVHLGQEDLQVADLEAIRNAGLRLGLSTHGHFEMLRALALHPSYLALGHIYATQTKQMPSSPQGLTRLKQQVTLLKKQIPTVAIGGISLARAESVWQTGVGSLAVVSAITQADAPLQAIQAFQKVIGEYPLKEQQCG